MQKIKFVFFVFSSNSDASKLQCKNADNCSFVVAFAANKMLYHTKYASTDVPQLYSLHPSIDDDLFENVYY